MAFARGGIMPLCIEIAVLAPPAELAGGEASGGFGNGGDCSRGSGGRVVVAAVVESRVAEVEGVLDVHRPVEFRVARRREGRGHRAVGAAARGTKAGPQAPQKARAERATLSSEAPENCAETVLMGPDFCQIWPLRSNTNQRSQVVDGYGHCVRNRRTSERAENGLE